jgi:hypothetical protein
MQINKIEPIKIYTSLKKTIKDVLLLVVGLPLMLLFLWKILPVWANILFEYLGLGASTTHSVHVPLGLGLGLLVTPFFLYNFIALRFFPYIKIDNDAIACFQFTSYETCEWTAIAGIISYNLDDLKIIIHKKDGATIEISGEQIASENLFVLIETLKKQAKYYNFAFHDSMDDSPKVEVPGFLN